MYLGFRSKEFVVLEEEYKKISDSYIQFPFQSFFTSLFFIFLQLVNQIQVHLYIHAYILYLHYYGTFGYGREFNELIDLNQLGGIV